MSRPPYLTLGDLEGKKDSWVKIKRVRFLGQMKLFCSTAAFFTKINLRKDKIYTILYIGSAPGSNFFILLKLLQEYKLIVHLFDINEHDKRLNTLKNLTIHSKLFTPDMFPAWTNIENLIFISDIRSVDDGQKEPSLKNLLTDYKIQFDAYDILKPSHAFLKLRYPFPTQIKKDFKMMIPQGEELLQICTGDSNERRLFLSSYKKYKAEIDYASCVSSESQMAFYNNYRNGHKAYDEHVFQYYIEKLFNICNIDPDTCQKGSISLLMNTISAAIRDDKVLFLPFQKSIRP